ncbi:MAG: ABC transporter substrate-binding protein [Thermodesulfobacteriota bacterium]|nr:ABC transporter substrate-binding protein [Thermodesulfobacteriota bacterium]
MTAKESPTHTREVALAKMVKHRGLILLPVVQALVLVSCETSVPLSPLAHKAHRSDRALRYDVNVSLTSLNPLDIFHGGGGTFVFPLLYSHLVVPNAQGALEPDLASKWSYDPEKRVWTVHLREGVLFHDNTPVTSRDVKYSFQAVLEKIHPLQFSLIEKISLLSDTALSIALKRDEPDFLHTIWDMEIVPQSREGKTDGYYQPIGSGPFRFEYRKGDREVGLLANEDYFLGRPSLDRVVFYFHRDKEKTWTRLLSGKTDVAHEISPKNYEMIKGHEERFHFHVYPLEWYTILLYNGTHPLFSDPQVRHALTHTIDRQHMVDEILEGCGVVASGPMGASSPFHNPEVKPIPYRPEKGLRLLQEAGWSWDKSGRHLVKDGQDFEFTLLVFEESQIEKKVAQYIRLCLNELGIKVHVKCLPYSELTRRYVGNDEYEALLTELGGAYCDPGFLESLWCPSGAKRAAGCLENAELSRLMGQAMREEDGEKKRDFLYEIDAMIASLQPGTFLFHKTAIDVMSKRFTLASPFSLKQAGGWRLKDATLNED